jgi:hypothetical protein
MQPQPAREKNSEAAAPTCQAVSHLDEPCNSPAIARCEKCDQWFCAAHAADDEWHACVLEEADIGGEG